jgi:SAM-dependent methyltransferase
MSSKGSIYNEDYYEHGIEKHISGYSHYRWIPELTIPMAMAMIDFLNIKRGQSILDFGSSKGYLVKAFRLLYRNAWGCDISEYAIKNCDKDVERYCLHSNGNIIPFNFLFDWCISKDVFEHIPEIEIPYILDEIRLKCKRMLVIVPLGNGRTFNIPDYNNDITHVTPKPIEWWSKMFVQSGWKIDGQRYKMLGVKDNWAEYPDGNGFFFLSQSIK